VASAHNLGRTHKSEPCADFCCFNCDVPMVFSSMAGFPPQVDRLYIYWLSAPNLLNFFTYTPNFLTSSSLSPSVTSPLNLFICFGLLQTFSDLFTITSTQLPQPKSLLQSSLHFRPRFAGLQLPPKQRSQARCHPKRLWQVESACLQP